MDNVERLYNENKLLVRAMDQPVIKTKNGVKYYECQTWVDEFGYLMNDGLFSLSTTLIVPGIGVKTYKNMGFLVDSSLATPFHIAKSDSGSCGSIRDGDFKANKPDFSTINELASYIKNNNYETMNEVNINVKLDGVVGLYINKCEISSKLLKKAYVAKKMIENYVGVSYPIYLYDWNIGKLELIDLNKEVEDELISNLDSDTIYCWPDECDKAFLIPITSSYHK